VARPIWSAVLKAAAGSGTTQDGDRRDLGPIDLLERAGAVGQVPGGVWNSTEFRGEVASLPGG